MRIIANTGTDRVVDLIRPWLRPDHQMDLASESFSLHAFGELADKLLRMAKVRLVLPPNEAELCLFGSDADRAARNRLQGRWLASRCADWVEKTVEVRRADRPVPQGAVVLRNGDGSPRQAVLGSFSFSTDGLGLAPGNPLNLIQASDTSEESERLSSWFDGQWSALPDGAIIEESGLLPIWSNPCLEALILRHFPGCEHLRPPTSNLAREELLRRWPDYRKPMSRLELRKKFGASDVQHAAGTSLDLLRFLKEIGFAV